MGDEGEWVDLSHPQNLHHPSVQITHTCRGIFPPSVPDHWNDLRRSLHVEALDTERCETGLFHKDHIGRSTGCQIDNLHIRLSAHRPRDVWREGCEVALVISAHQSD